MGLSSAPRQCLDPRDHPNGSDAMGLHSRAKDLLLSHSIYNHQARARLLLIQLFVFSTTLFKLVLVPM